MTKSIIPEKIYELLENFDFQELEPKDQSMIESQIGRNEYENLRKTYLKVALASENPFADGPVNEVHFRLNKRKSLTRRIFVVPVWQAAASVRNPAGNGFYVRLYTG